jgi:putative FmdB family regulatory protein
MPLYDYRCRGCNKIFGALRGINEQDKDVVCPLCGEKKSERLMSPCHAVTGKEAPANPGSCNSQKFT